MSIPQPPISKMPSNEADILLAISAIYTSQVPAVSRAAATYNVVESTLRNSVRHGGRELHSAKIHEIPGAPGVEGEGYASTI
jgi:hypothetical protein